MSKKFMSFLLLCFGFVVTANSQQGIVLSANNQSEIGQAFFVQQNQNCYAIMPTHVFGNKSTKKALLLEGVDSLYAEADDTNDLGDDVAITSVNGIDLNKCGPLVFGIQRNIDKILEKSSTQELRFINGDGSVGKMAVSIIDNDKSQFVRVLPINPKMQISKGMSGSLLRTGDVVLGMLVSVDAKHGYGTIIRQNYLMEKIDSWLRNKANQLTDDKSPLINKLSVTAWSSPAISPDHSASNLILADSQKDWQAKAVNWPIVIDVSLGDDMQIVSGVDVDVRTIPTDMRPSNLELLVSPTGNTHSWVSVLTVSPELQDETYDIRFLPKRAKHIRLSIFAPKNGGDTVGLSSIKILN